MDREVQLLSNQRRRAAQGRDRDIETLSSEEDVGDRKGVRAGRGWVSKVCYLAVVFSVCYWAGYWLRRARGGMEDGSHRMVRLDYDDLAFQIPVQPSAPPPPGSTEQYPLVNPEMCSEADSLIRYINKHGGFTTGIAFRKGEKSRNAQFGGAGSAEDGEENESSAVQGGRVNRVGESGGGRTLVATRTLANDDVVARIPMELTMSAYTALESQEFRKIIEMIMKGQERDRFSPIGRNVVEQDFPHVDDLTLLLIFLLHESFKIDSAWRPYLCSLPRFVNLPLQWPKEKLKEGIIKYGPKFTKRMQTMGREMIDSYLNATTYIIDRNPSVFSPEKYTFKAWQWAYSIVVSRAWRVRAPEAMRYIFPKINVLVPLADMANHKEGARVLGKTQDDFQLVVSGSVSKGDEIWISYGNKCNDALLADYGFVAPGDGDENC